MSYFGGESFSLNAATWCHFRHSLPPGPSGHSRWPLLSHLHQPCQYAGGVSDNPAHLKSAWDAYIKAPRSLPVLWCLHLLIEQPAFTILVCCFFHFYSLAFILGFKKRSCEVLPDYQIIHCIKEMTIPTLSDSYCIFLILYSPYAHYIKLKLPR